MTTEKTRVAHEPGMRRVDRGGEVVLVTAGLAGIAMAIYQVATPGPPGSGYVTVSDFVREALTLTLLIASMAAVVVARRSGVTGRTAMWLILVGYGLIAVGVLAGLLLRDDPEWFFLLGAPGNLAGGIGFVVMAVGIWRRHELSRWAAVLCGVGGFFAILLAELGTTVLIGAFWLYLAVRLRHDAAR